jgi:hypothetical protein
MMNEKRFYNTGEPQCAAKTLVGDLPLLCVCEFPVGHVGEHELVPTMRQASREQLSTLRWEKEFDA